MLARRLFGQDVQEGFQILWMTFWSEEGNGQSLKNPLGTHNLSLRIFVTNEHEDVNTHLLFSIGEACLSKRPKFVMCNTV
jgi:hypothetical protein